MSRDPGDLAQKLTQWRECAHLSQSKLAAAATSVGPETISQSLISQWESGERMPTTEGHVQALAVSLSLSADESMELLVLAGLAPANRLSPAALRLRVTVLLGRAHQARADYYLPALDLSERLDHLNEYIDAAQQLDHGAWRAAEAKFQALVRKVSPLQVHETLRLAENLSRLGKFREAEDLLSDGLVSFRPEDCADPREREQRRHLAARIRPEDDWAQARLLGRRGGVELRLGHFSDSLHSLTAAQTLLDSMAPVPSHAAPALEVDRAWLAKRQGELWMFLRKPQQAQLALDEARRRFDAIDSPSVSVQREEGLMAVDYLLGWAYQRLALEPTESQPVALAVRAIESHLRGVERARAQGDDYRMLQGTLYVSEDLLKLGKLTLPSEILSRIWEVTEVGGVASVGLRDTPHGLSETPYRALLLARNLARQAISVSERLEERFNRGRIELNLARIELALSEATPYPWEKERHQSAAKDYLRHAMETEIDRPHRYDFLYEEWKAYFEATQDPEAELYAQEAEGKTAKWEEDRATATRDAERFAGVLVGTKASPMPKKD